MAFQGKNPIDNKKSGGKIKGANDAKPTVASKPSFRYPAYRGLPDPSPKTRDETGEVLPLTGYGTQEWLGPSSVGVQESADLSDFDIRPKGGDAERAKILSGGTSRNPVDNGQTRTLAPGNVPTNPGTSGASPGPKVPAKLGMAEGQPVRKPGA